MSSRAGVLAAAVAGRHRVARPGAAVALRGRLPRHRVLGRAGGGGGGAARGPRAVRGGPGPMRGALRRLAVVLGGRRGAGRPGAGAVQGVLPRGCRVAGRRGGDDLPLHLGRPRLRTGARVDPGFPEEARPDRDDARVRAGLPGRGAHVRRRLLGARAADRARDGHARAGVGGGADPQRPAARQPSAISPGSRRAGTTTRPSTSWSAPRAATARSRRSTRAPRRWSSTPRPARSTPPWPRYASATGSASPSPTPSTTSRPWRRRRGGDSP